MSKLILERGTDFLLLETGDALLLFTLAYTESASVTIGVKINFSYCSLILTTLKVIVPRVRMAIARRIRRCK